MGEGFIVKVAALPFIMYSFASAIKPVTYMISNIFPSDNFGVLEIKALDYLRS